MFFMHSKTAVAAANFAAVHHGIEGFRLLATAFDPTRRAALSADAEFGSELIARLLRPLPKLTQMISNVLVHLPGKS